MIRLRYLMQVHECIRTFMCNPSMRYLPGPRLIVVVGTVGFKSVRPETALRVRPRRVTSDGSGARRADAVRTWSRQSPARISAGPRRRGIFIRNRTGVRVMQYSPDHNYIFILCHNPLYSPEVQNKANFPAI